LASWLQVLRNVRASAGGLSVMQRLLSRGGQNMCGCKGASVLACGPLCARHPLLQARRMGGGPNPFGIPRRHGRPCVSDKLQSQVSCTLRCHIAFPFPFTHTHLYFLYLYRKHNDASCIPSNIMIIMIALMASFRFSECPPLLGLEPPCRPFL